MIVIGLDVGTTGTKALAVDEKGRVLASAYRGYGLISGDAGCVAQSADDWWDAVKYTVGTVAKKVSPEKIGAISLSTQGATMLAADKDGAALCDAMTWMDHRAVRETEYLDGAIGAEAVYRKCGWRLDSWGDAAKILWMKNNLPDVFESAACFPSTIEFVNKKLTGRFVTDPTNAAIRQLFNIEKGKWDREILDAVGISEDRLPEVVPTGSPVGTLTSNAASELGLTTDALVFCGAHDQYCASIGAGAVEVGDMMLATGTAWVILGITDSLLFTADHISPGIHPAGGYGAMASLVSAGSALSWYRDVIEKDYREIDREAEKVQLEAKDVLVLPYIAGAGFPHGRADASLTIHGLGTRHNKYHIACAVMEGVAFEAKTVLEEFAANGMKIDRLMMTGGAARSDLWSKIVRDVTRCEIIRPTEPETCCLGAASIALVSLGVYDDYKECARAVTSSAPLGAPDEALAAFYDEKYGRYRELRRKMLNG